MTPSLAASFEFAARTFVRTMSAEFEARLFLLQQLLLVTNEHCDEKLSAHEETVLRAEAPYIKGNGKLGTSSRFYASIDNLSFSLQLARKRFGDFVFCSKQDARWNSVLVFVDIRNRLTHPKRIQDLEISEKEVRALNEAQDWLREAFKSVFKHPAMVHAVKQHADVSKLRGEDQGSSFD